MSEQPRAGMSEAARRGARAILLCAVAIALVWLALDATRRRGLAKAVEFKVYDLLVRLRGDAAPPRASPFVIVAITDRDIAELPDYPVDDGDLAKVLTALVDAGATTVAVDIYRDKPRAGRDALCAAIALDQDDARQDRLPRLLFIERLPGAAATLGGPVEHRGPDCADPAYQLAWNNVVVDFDGVCRRAYFSPYHDAARDVVRTPLAMAIALSHAWHRAVAAGATPTELRTASGGVSLGATAYAAMPGDALAYAGAADLADADAPQMLIDYAGAAAAPPARLTFLDVLRGRFDPAIVRGRAVLVGVIADSVKDFEETPIGRRYGVEIQAMVADQFLRGLDAPLAPTYLGAGRQRLWTLAWLALAAAAMVAPSVRGYGPAWLVGVALAVIVGQVGATWWLFARGVYVPVVATAAGAMLTAGIVYLVPATLERRRRQLLQALFGRMQGERGFREIERNADAILSGRGIRARQVRASILFSDLRHFTRYCEAQAGDEARVFELLNDYFAAMVRAVEHNGGFVNKFIGDSVMAVFGATAADADVGHAADACRAALAMRDAMAAFALRHPDEVRNFGLATRIGIHSGTVLAGGVGDGQRRLEYTFNGDAVNVASRLEGFGKDRPELMSAPHLEGECRILLSGQTLAMLPAGAFRCERVAEGPLAGRGGTVAVYSLLGPNAGRAQTNG